MMYIHKILINHIQTIHSSGCRGDVVSFFLSQTKCRLVEHSQYHLEPVTAAALDIHCFFLSLFWLQAEDRQYSFFPFLFPSLCLSIFGVSWQLTVYRLSTDIHTFKVHRKIRGQTRAAKAAVPSQLQNIPLFNNCTVVPPQSLFNLQRLHWRVVHSYTLNQQLLEISVLKMTVFRRRIMIKIPTLLSTQTLDPYGATHHFDAHTELYRNKISITFKYHFNENPILFSLNTAK